MNNASADENVFRRPDSYHTCYALVGLSLTQHFHYFEQPTTNERFASVVTWKAIQGPDGPQYGLDPDVSDEMDAVKAVHPVYVISHESVEMMRRWATALDAPLDG